MIKMEDLRGTLTAAGLSDVHTYIQSGNVIFTSSESDTTTIAALIKTTIEKQFSLTVEAVVFSKDEWSHIVASAPDWWGEDQEWKHNLLVLLPPYDMHDVVRAIGTLRPDIESMEVGEGVLYQSMSLKLFGRTTTGKLASSPIYKKMTIRNYNTATKLLQLFK